MTIAALVLAAGRGKRLRPLTDERPKPCVPILDVPLIAWALERMAPLGEVVVNASHLHERLRACLGELDGTHEVFVEHPEPLGTLGTLVALRDRLDETVVTWNADSIIDLDPGALLTAHDGNGALATLAVTRVEEEPDFVAAGEEIVLVDRRTHGGGAGWRFAGVAALERAALDDVDARAPIGLTEGLFRPLADRAGLALHPIRDRAVDVGTPTRYLAATLAVLRGELASPVEPPGQVVDVAGGVAYLGPGASAPSSALGPGAVVLRGGHVARGAVVDRVIVWPDESVPPGTEISDAIWFGGRAIAAG